MKKTKLISASLSALLPCTLFAAGADKEKMNIVVVLADDLGWGDVGFHGSDILTPNIDAMATEGIVLDRFYTAPVSSPTRAGFLTGRYPNRFGIREEVIPPWRDFGLDVEEETLADMLGEAGYANRAILGKWHLGHSGREFYPLERGFTHFYGHLNGAIDYFTHVRDGQLDWHNDWETCYDEGYSTDLLTEEAVKCIEQYSRQDSPFFLYVAYNAPHGPLGAKDSDIALYTDDFESLTPQEKKRVTYSAMVTCLDAGIGRIREALRDAGIEENTLFLFFSDNGGEPASTASSGPLRGHKFQEWDGGTRVPAIVSYPAKWTGKRTVSSVVGFVDIMPTIRAMLNIQGEPHRPFDGIDISSLLSGEVPTIDRDFYLGCGAVVNNDYKLIKKGRNSKMDFVQDYFLCYYPQNPYEEKNSWNLKEDNPHKAEIERLQKVIEKYDTIVPPVALPPYNEGKEGFVAPFEWNVDFYGGGECHTPQAISSYEDLEIIRNNLDKEFYLTADITVPDGIEWISIGAATSTDSNPKPFSGVLDGRGHSIKQVKVTRKGDCKGLFGRLYHAHVKDLDLIDLNISGDEKVGGLAGEMSGGSRIERVSVNGSIQGETEVGGMVGKVGRDSIFAFNNTIYDSYVNAHVKALSMSTDVALPSRAGGLAATVDDASGKAVAKLDLQRVYVAGSVESAQISHLAGCAAGLVAHCGSVADLKVGECLVLADNIKAAVPALFLGGGDEAALEETAIDGLFARNDIELDYYDVAHKGLDEFIPEDRISSLPFSEFKREQFYKTLSWDMERLWSMEEGRLPELRRTLDYPLDDTAVKIIYVSPDGNGKGTSWADAADIYTAVAQARDYEKHQIWLQKGSYLFTETIDFDHLFIYGGFNGTETLLEERNWVDHPVILDGGNKVSLLRNRMTTTPITHVPCVLDGVIVQNGLNPNNMNGGAMLSNDGTVLRNCIFRNNQTVGGKFGAALHCQVGSTIIENCLFVNNTSSGNGGAVQVGGNASVSFINCTLANNDAVGLGGAIGVGANTSNTTLVNTVLYNNRSDQGRLFNSYSQNTNVNGGGKVLSIHSAVESGSAKFADGDDVNHIALSRTVLPGFSAPASHIGRAATPDEQNEVNAASYELLAGSLCIDVGNSEQAAGLPYDLARKERISGHAVDVGAYEYIHGEVVSVPDNSVREDIQTFVAGDELYVSGAKVGSQLSLFDIKGSLVHARKVTDGENNTVIRLPEHGMYFVCVDNVVLKVKY